MVVRNMTYVALRIMAIYIFIMSIRHIVNLMPFTSPFIKEQELSDIVLYGGIVAPIGLLLAASILLWFFASSIARLTVRGMTDEEKNAETGPELAKLQTAAFTVVGLVLIVTALPPLIALLAQLLAFGDVMSEGMVRSWLGTGVEGVVELLLGIYLLFGSRGLSAGLNQVRGLGLKSPEQ